MDQSMSPTYGPEECPGPFWRVEPPVLGANDTTSFLCDNNAGLALRTPDVAHLNCVGKSCSHDFRLWRRSAPV